MRARSFLHTYVTGLMGCLFTAGSVERQSVLYVDADATGPTHDGSSWCEAYVELSEALSLGVSGDVIRVANGRYTPDPTGLENPREATFQLLKDVTIEGGYAGCGAPAPNDRNIRLFPTVLSGDLRHNDNPGEFPFGPSYSDNTYHVVTGSTTDATAAIDGFTITAGIALGHVYPHGEGGGVLNIDGNPTVISCAFTGNWGNRGGGMCNRDSTPTLTACTFRENSSGWVGGGVFNWRSRPILTDCIFLANFAEHGGGGMCNMFSSATLVNCTFIDNSVYGFGGGILNDDSSPTLTDCTFSGNSANGGGGMWEGYGGAMCNSESSPNLINCTFDNNSARQEGGGMYNEGYSMPTLIRCGFTGNWASDGGGMYNNSSSPTLANCTFKGNSARQRGGGLHAVGHSLQLMDCTFSGNSANTGGGMWNGYANATLSACTFSANSADGYAGGMCNYYSSSTLINSAFNRNSCSIGGGMYTYGGEATFVNCTFAENSALNGQAIACDSYQQDYPNSVEMDNCILWNGGEEIWNNDGSTITISYSNVQDDEPNDGIVCPGTGNIDANPLFVPGPAGCYYLSQTQAGDAQQSPCVDAGSDTAANLGLDVMTTGSDEITDTGIVDMGYHYPVTGAPLVMGDYDRSGRVDLRDFTAFQRCFTGDGPSDVTPRCRIFDFQSDRDVDLDDVVEFQSAMNGP